MKALVVSALGLGLLFMSMKMFSLLFATAADFAKNQASMVTELTREADRVKACANAAPPCNANSNPQKKETSE